MRLRIAVVLIAVGGAVGILFLLGGASAVASNEASIAAVPLAMTTVADTEHEFVGSKKCKMCHKDLYESWKETTHAKGFDILKPGERKEAKEKFKLDPAKDYTTDESCLACHVTGFGKEGGYAVPDAADEKAVKKMAKLAGAGCECCHGAGKDFCQVKKAIKKAFKENGTKYKFADLAAAGMAKIEAGTCTCCHSDKSPTYDDSKKFDFDKMVKDEKAIHAHVPLKMREG